LAHPLHRFSKENKEQYSVCTSINSLCIHNKGIAKLLLLASAYLSVCNNPRTTEEIVMKFDDGKF
jgi:hypothetical protein